MSEKTSENSPKKYLKKFSKKVRFFFGEFFLGKMTKKLSTTIRQNMHDSIVQARTPTVRFMSEKMPEKCPKKIPKKCRKKVRNFFDKIFQGKMLEKIVRKKCSKKCPK